MACSRPCFGTTAAVDHRHALTRSQQLGHGHSCSLWVVHPVRGLGLGPKLHRRLQRRWRSPQEPKCSCPSFQCGLLVFASAGPEAGTSTLVVQEVDFMWQGEAAEVLLTGDFLGWDSRVALEKGEDGIFHYKQKLPPGKYQYKYIVDGQWLHSPDRRTVSDGKGGFNNEIIVADISPVSSAGLPKTTVNKEVKDGGADAELKAESSKLAKETPTKAAPKPAPSSKLAKETETKAAPKPAPKGAPAAKVAVKKVPDKDLPTTMVEDVIPALNAALQKEDDVLNIEIGFQENQLEGSFTKNGILYTFWAFFPDGKLQGTRGFSLSSYGAPPSTVEPFLIDEKKVTSELLVFWIMKRLRAQRVLALN